MIHLIDSNKNIFDKDVQALVNPINCVGAMGKGLALQFKNRYPNMFEDYKQECKLKEIHIGKMWVWKTDELLPEYIINFPTKDHWRDKSKYEWIVAGLLDLELTIRHYKIQSISIPALGCGLGGLNFKIIKQYIESSLSELDCEIYIYEP